MKPVSPALASPVSVATGQPGAGSLNVLRFLAAAFIVVFHYASHAPLALTGWPPVLRQGWLATDFFLMLSGYILSRVYGERVASGRIAPRQFVVRRFMRLWPAHVIVLLAMALFVVVSSDAGDAPGHADHYSWIGFVAQLFLVHGWGMFSAPGWNVPTWTLSTLLVCYALFSLYVPRLYRRSVWIWIGVGLAVFIVAEILALGVAHNSLVDLPFAWGLLRSIPLFVLGNVVERVAGKLRVGRISFCVIIGLCLTSIIVLAGQPRNTAIDTIVLALLATVLAVSGAVSFPETTATRRMGQASFAVFLVHSLVGAVWFGLMAKLSSRMGMTGDVTWLLWSMGVAAALTAAFAFEAWVHAPLSRRMSRLAWLRD